MRTRCSGETPCEKCIKDEAACLLSDRKRERNKKSISHFPINSFKPLIDHRDLIATKQRVWELESKNNQLLQALKTVAQLPALPADERAILMELTSGVIQSIAQLGTLR
jgi:hypothetical protein